MHPPQRLARLDPELLGERAPRLVVGLERLGVAARAVEGEHQLATRSLAQRLLGDQGFELRNHGVDIAQRELRLGALLAHCQHELFERGQRGIRERSLGEVVERRPAPQRERLVEAAPRAFRVFIGEVLTAAVEQSLAACDVGRAGIDVEQVPGRARDDDVAERAPQMRHVAVQRGDRRVGRLLAPHALYEPRGGDDAPRLERQHRQHAAPAHAAERERLPVAEDLERPQQPELKRGFQRPNLPVPTGR